MVLLGTYERSLDDKLRLALPKRLRELLGAETELVITPGTDGSLALFAPAAFAALAERLASRSPVGQDVRAFSRLLYAQSHSVEIDTQGRIRLPLELARQAELAGDVVLLGVGDHMEIWNKSRWEAYFAHLSPRYDQLAESALCDPAPRGAGDAAAPSVAAAPDRGPLPPR